MAKVKLTLEYEYEGDETTAEAAAQSEKDFWTSGAVGVDDLVSAGSDFKLTVEVTGEFEDAEETADADED